MKKISFAFISSLLLYGVAAGQDRDDYIQRPTLGIHFVLNDFVSASNIKNSSLKDALKNNQFGNVKDMVAGLAVNYMSGLSRHFDVSTTLSASFIDYPFENRGVVGNDFLLLEADLSIRAKMLSNRYVINPYLQAGVGASRYQNYYGAIVPLGVGLQFNILNESYVLINAQYRIGVTENTSDHFFYSLGLAGRIGERKEKPAPVTVVPLPQPEPPKDRDGDGILDSADACPDVKGLAQFNGCPDTDNDGLADKDDKCPEVAGLPRYQGCPIPDTDGDGINDEEDKCKDVKGLPRYQGCPIPDGDNDGVNDEEDKCPTLPGPVANGGCPEIKAEIRKRVDVASKSIFFATGSSKLLSKSNKSLNDLVKILKDDPNLKLDINGHTDNVGKPEKNQLLSEKRATAVSDYLQKKGIEASRVKATGFGQDQPIADNKKASGRAKNRRVELQLHYN